MSGELISFILTPIVEGECEHAEIVPCKLYPDGSIDGRCTACGDDTFAIRDVPHEVWMERCPTCDKVRFADCDCPF